MKAHYTCRGRDRHPADWHSAWGSKACRVVQDSILNGWCQDQRELETDANLGNPQINLDRHSCVYSQLINFTYNPYTISIGLILVFRLPYEETKHRPQEYRTRKNTSHSKQWKKQSLSYHNCLCHFLRGVHNKFGSHRTIAFAWTRHGAVGSHQQIWTYSYLPWYLRRMSAWRLQ